jgi:hypothetical protein
MAGELLVLRRSIDMPLYDDEETALPPVIPGPVPFQKTRALNTNSAGLPLVFEHMPGGPVNVGRAEAGAVDPVLPPPVMPPETIAPPAPMDPSRSATANLPRVPMEDTLMNGILNGAAKTPPPEDEEEAPLGF